MIQFNNKFHPIRVLTFGQLKPRLINIMMSAIQVETDSHNTHMLLGGLLLCVQDSVSFEETECSASDVHSSSAKEGNLFSSGKWMCRFKWQYKI